MEGRDFLKSQDWDRWQALPTDQKEGVPPPPICNPVPEGARLIPLPAAGDIQSGHFDLREAIARRVSHRKYLPEALSLDELVFLLWATQGIRQIVNPKRHFRTVPSAGSRHPFETYLVVQSVTGLEPGLYRYDAVGHQLVFIDNSETRMAEVKDATDNPFVHQAAVTFIWSVVPYRSEWRYTFQSHKVIALDAGHVCQNLYLACEAVNAGTCAVGAYDQARIDAALGLDGQDEFVIYLAPVGKVR